MQDTHKLQTDSNPATMNAEEKEMEQKMIKVILGMPAEVQARFKVQHMLADQRHKLNDEFDVLVKKLEQKYADKKKPLHK